MAGYANEAALVSTDWVAEHLNDPAVRLIDPVDVNEVRNAKLVERA